MFSSIVVFIIGFLAASIVTSIARRNQDKDVFGLGSAAFFTTISVGLLGSFFFGYSGGIFGALIGAVVIEEVIRKTLNNKAKPLNKRVFCSACGFKQERGIDKKCENCGELLRI